MGLTSVRRMLAGRTPIPRRPVRTDVRHIAPLEAWHYCADYRGPQVSNDVVVWRRATPRAAQVGAGSKTPADPANPTAPGDGRDGGEPPPPKAIVNKGNCEYG